MTETDVDEAILADTLESNYEKITMRELEDLMIFKRSPSCVSRRHPKGAVRGK
jgi:hypothetical protein